MSGWGLRAAGAGRHCAQAVTGIIASLAGAAAVAGASLPGYQVIRLPPAQVGSEPTAAVRSTLPVPSDKPFSGTIELAVNASDTDHQIFSAHETIPIQSIGDMVLLYPEWETASHAPTAGVAELAGLMVHVDGKLSDWMRDPVDMHAFHVNVPAGARSMTLDFQFLAPFARRLLRPDMVECLGNECSFIRRGGTCGIYLYGPPSFSRVISRHSPR